MATMLTLICTYCGIEFTRSATYWKYITTYGRVEPFCSKLCSGKYRSLHRKRERLTWWRR
jgi:hypothetical protein